MKRFLPLVLLLSSCATPYSISQLKPIDQQSSWLWGREYIQKTVQDVTVKLAYENNDRNYTIFNVTIENNSDTVVLIEPEKFFVTLSGAKLYKSVPRQQLARNPETFFLDLEKQRSRLHAEEVNTAILYTTEVLTETANTVVSWKKGETPTEAEQRQLAIDDADYRRQVEDYDLKMKTYSLNQQKFYFDEQLLRKTTLPPHSFMYGKVFFPRNYDASTYELAIPVKDTVLTFQYSQTLIQP